MKTKILIAFALIFSIAIFGESFAQKAAKTKVDVEFESFWKEFKEAVNQKNFTTLKKLILDDDVYKSFIVNSEIPKELIKELNSIKTKKIANISPDWTGDISDYEKISKYQKLQGFCMTYNSWHLTFGIVNGSYKLVDVGMCAPD